ncbi:MAG: sugar ABC transporter permease [Eubacteriales bacterium]|nr:sugar ABC transporter permease [Eubacteriales bacterium]
MKGISAKRSRGSGQCRKWEGFLFILPSLAGVLVFIFIPFLDVIRRSFTEVMSGKFVGLKNFRTVFSNTAFRQAAYNTFRFTGICIPMLIFCSLAAAVLLQGQKKMGSILKSMYLMPMAIPVASVVLLWKLLFHVKGMLNGILSLAGMRAVDWMNSEYAFGVLVFSYIWKNLGYDVILWLAGLAGISGDIYEAARVDGAGEWRCFISITLPNLLPSLYTIAVLSFLNSFKVFREAYLVAGDYPHSSIYMMQHLFNNWFRELSLDKMAAGAVVNAVVILMLVLLLQRVWEKE